jgi:type I restriction enzyme S subunit
MARTQWIVALARGIRERSTDFRFDGFAGQVVPMPSRREQDRIALFLAHADRRINHLIHVKGRLITLLNEQKQAIIHRTVTCGLDPNVRLKRSGVEWLGDVPEHWEVMPIKRAFLSMDYGISESASDSGMIRLLTMGHLKDGRVTVPATGGVDSVDSSLLLQAGDLLFNRTNSPELVGKVGLFVGHESPVTFASYLVRMRPRPNHEPEYLNAVLNDATFLSIVRREAIPSLHQSNLNPTRYGRLHIALPPQGEQQAILQVLQQETGGLIEGIIATRSEINLLREYRTRLIADVVTGKLDVRGVELPAMDEAEALEDWETDEDAQADEMDEMEGVDA